MTYIKFGPASDFESIHKKIHNFFDEFPNIGVDINYSLKPRVDYYTDAENAYLEVEIPGVKKEDIKISLKANILTVAGEKKDVSGKSKDGKVFKTERNFGPFTRDFQLPEGLNTENIQASFEDGVLKVTIAKNVKSTTQEKEIKIN